MHDQLRGVIHDLLIQRNAHMLECTLLC
jgi:hypothetical protein